ncbi:Protein LemA [Carnimonas sp. R-84981]|uniref:LemA family protein n=1 Tax=Carnimonas bestiolae TaxID=3402172 RepID=UPI003EDC2F48
MRNFLVILLATLTVALSGCGYNDMQTSDEQVKASWSEVLSQYQRRADLIPDLVSTVKGYAQHEQDTLTQVTEARARATSINATPELVDNPEAFKKFESAQSGLTQALSKLMVVSERYPDLKANQNFRDLQAQLEGTENRITVARHRYIDSIQKYNVLIRQFPGVITAKLFGYKVKPNFNVENEDEISHAPNVDFGNSADAK